VVRDGLRLVDVPAGGRLRDPDRRHARSPERALRPRGGAEGLMSEDTPQRPDERQVPKVGVDSWVATHAGRVEGTRLQAELARIPRPAFYAGFAVFAALLPAFTSSGYIVRVGFDTLLYMLLALGLNIVVGYAGLLDLGYVAFYGFGAYAYAM